MNPPAEPLSGLHTGAPLCAQEPPPADPPRLVELVQAAEAKGDLPEAERLVRRLIEGLPEDASARYMLGHVLRARGDLSAAQEALRACLRLAQGREPMTSVARYALAECQLSEGRYDQTAWSLYEARHRCAGFRPKPDEVIPAPEWTGGDLRGKRLVILPEQGLGDEIQFARFAPWLQETTGAAVTLVCEPRLVRLFEGLPVTVRSTDEIMVDSYTQRTADAWVLSMSIPAAAGLTLPDLPSAPYLAHIGPAADRGGRVGVVTRGNPAHRNDAYRSLPPEAAAALHSLPGAISLHPEDTGARDFADTAAIIAGLDLVVSADTSVAHLAGAMGKPVWVLLPGYRTDWRWMRGRTDSPWYPSARLYRQTIPGDWGEVTEAVRRDLSAASI